MSPCQYHRKFFVDNSIESMRSNVWVLFVFANFADSLRFPIEIRIYQKKTLQKFATISLIKNSILHVSIIVICFVLIFLFFSCTCSAINAYVIACNGNISQQKCPNIEPQKFVPSKLTERNAIPHTAISNVYVDLIFHLH